MIIRLIISTVLFSALLFRTINKRFLCKTKFFLQKVNINENKGRKHIIYTGQKSNFVPFLKRNNVTIDRSCYIGSLIFTVRQRRQTEKFQLNVYFLSSIVATSQTLCIAIKLFHTFLIDPWIHCLVISQNVTLP